MTADVVAVLDSDLSQVFELARPIKATVQESAKLMQHPVERGGEVADHRVILPVEIELALVIGGEEYESTYQTIRELFQRGELLTVQTRTGLYESMAIERLPHEESPEAADAVNMALKLCEVQFVEAQFSDLKVASKTDGKTVKRGEQKPQDTPTEKKGSILSGLFK